MKLQCEQEALAEALTTVGRAVSTKATLPILGNVLLEAEPVGALRLVATNLDLTISRRIPAGVSVPGRITVPARLLSDYVALLDKSKQVSLSVGSKGGKLHLLCERYEANIATLPADDFPAVPATDREPCLEVDGAVLKAAIDQVVFAVAPDDTRPVLAGVLIRLEAGNLTLAAADGFRLAVRSVEMPRTGASSAWIVPARTLLEVSRCLLPVPGLPVALRGSVTDHHLHIGMGNTEITTRLIEGQFPDYERIIPRDCATTVIINSADFLRATRVASVFARDNAHIVRLECTPSVEDGAPIPGRITVASTSAELGDNAGQLEANVSGDDVQIAFNGRYLRDALEALDSPQVALQFSGRSRPGVLRPVGELETAYLQIIMPLHLAR